MASTFAVTRNHLIFGLCLPLAVLLGYMLADIDDPASRLVILVALAILAVPVLMRWYHPLLVLSWHMAAQPALLPGNPQLWSLMALLGLAFAVLNRSVNSEHQFAHVPSLTRPMAVFTLVVLVTALLTGGIGLRIFGSTAVGGRGYFYILAAVAGFFALSSRPIPPKSALLYVALFFLPGLTAIASRVAGMLGNKASFVYLIFPADFQTDDFIADPTFDASMMRVSGSVGASLAMFCWLLARYGITGVFDLSRPWRLVLLVATLVGSMFGGYRSALLLMLAVFFILFTLEKLWRTRLTLGLLMAGILGAALLVGFADRLPLAVQRTLSFLPINLDTVTKETADFSTQWRLDMWKSVLPEVPKYLLKGKGYSYSADDLFLAQLQSRRLGSVSSEEAAFAGDYHNGPLSVVIPFGAAGLLVFGWLVVAGARFLYTVYQNGAPELRQINALLLALFLARLLVFFFIFGSLYTELCLFAGILGFSVALNVAGRKQVTEAVQVAETEEAPV